MVNRHSPDDRYQESLPTVDPLTKFLVERYTGRNLPNTKVTDQATRTSYAYLEALVSIVGNLALSLVKVVMGLLLNSISLLADAAHTAADVLTSLVILVGFRLAKTPADEKHPFGHGRMEFLASLLIAVLLVTVGIEFGVSSYNRLQARTPVAGNFVVAAVMAVGAIIKEWMTRFAICLGKRTDAKALIGDGWHHRTDAVASVLVAVAMVASKYGYYWVDAVLGLGVSALILYTGVELAISSGSSLLGEQPPKDMVEAIKAAVLTCEGVKDLHKVMVHDYGARKSVSLHVLVSQSLTVVESHEIASRVEQALRANIEGDIVVHVEPES